jgi:hypothetical protein
VVVVDSKKQSGAAIVRRGGRNGPRVAKVLAKYAFLDRSSGDYGSLENQWEWSIIAFSVHPGNIEHGCQSALRVKNGRAGTA